MLDFKRYPGFRRIQRPRKSRQIPACRHQAEVLNLLMEVRRDVGTTLVFVTHDLGVIAHMC